jgi:hypothetical protein
MGGLMLFFVFSLSPNPQTWKHNRFEAYKRNTPATAERSLPPGTNGSTTALLREINDDKKRVGLICGQQCIQLWLEAANLCDLTFECPATPGRRLACRRRHDIGVAWKQDSGPRNCKKIAFIFDFYGSEVYRRALSTTHQDATSSHVLAKLGVRMDVSTTAMTHGHKTCVQQQYGNTSKVHKNNLLRMGYNHHQVRVNRERAKVDTNKPNWKRPKHVFFTVRGDLSNPTKKVVETVSSASDITLSFVAC